MSHQQTETEWVGFCFACLQVCAGIFHTVNNEKKAGASGELLSEVTMNHTAPSD
jgi:hypothetical protein